MKWRIYIENLDINCFLVLRFARQIFLRLSYLEILYNSYFFPKYLYNKKYLEKKINLERKIILNF